LVNNANDKSISFSSGQTKSAPQGGQSEVEAEEGFVTLKEFL
jgi:hypothetical protein